MQFHSFDTRDPLIAIDPWQISFQVITLENTYGLDPDRLVVSPTADGWQVTCDGLAWAGGQRRAPGSLTARFTHEGEQLRVAISAEAPVPIRCVKLLLRDLPPVTPLNPPGQLEGSPADGVLLRYPNQLRLPLLVLRESDGDCVPTGLRSEDPQTRAKRFAIYAERHGPLTGRYAVELIHEEDARYFDSHMDVPDWIIGPVSDPAAFVDAQLAFNEAQLGLTPWDRRADVPGWARQISLVLTIHCMHWTGYTFNTYDDARSIVEFVAARFPGERVLALLPGWEGRYYWQYADYRPEPMLGGSEGFTRLVDASQTHGVHLMPFFGVTGANAWHSPGFPLYGPSSRMQAPTRNTYWGNRPDWDISRGRDTGWQAWLNIGAPHWRAELTRQIAGTMDRYGLDAAFLDCPEVWVNDPDHNIREGLHALVNDLRAPRPNLLITGEDWWDGILDVLPLCQHTRKWRSEPAWAGRYARFFEHIADSEPSRGSTGVFESGYAPYEPLPLDPMYIPTIAFVDGTLAHAPEAVEAAIAQARRYAAGDFT